MGGKNSAPLHMVAAGGRQGGVTEAWGLSPRSSYRLPTVRPYVS